MITDYFEEIERTVSEFLPIIHSQSLSTKLYSRNKGFIKGEIIFADGSSLSFAEVIALGEAEKPKYRYHFMDSSGNLIFRYDNAPHYPDLDTFPHHKHVPGKVIGCAEPTLPDVLLEIYNLNFKQV